MTYELPDTDAVTSTPLSVSCVSTQPALGEMVQVLEARCAVGVLQETLPPPAGALPVMLKFCGTNFAVTVVLLAGLMLQVVLVPLHPPPLQPAKESPATAVAVSTIWLPLRKLAEALLQ